MNALSIMQAEYNDLFGDSDSGDENFMGFESMDSDDGSENGDPDTTDDENQNQPGQLCMRSKPEHLPTRG